MATTYLTLGVGTGGVATCTLNLTARFNFIGTTMGNALDFELFNANSPCDIQSLNLTSGVNTINATNCPAITSAGGVFLIPPAGNSTAVTLKGASGDTGIALSLTAPTFVPFTIVPPTSFVLTTGGAITGYKLAFV